MNYADNFRLKSLKVGEPFIFVTGHRLSETSGSFTNI
jgi:hypothetical protein